MSNVLFNQTKNRENTRAHISAAGNWCAHDPVNPKFFEPPESHARRPDVLQFAAKNLEKFYDFPGKWLKSLSLTSGTTRQERSEGRERDASVMQILLHYLELASMRVGIPNADGVFLPLDMKFIAKRLKWRTDADDIDDKARVEQGLNPRNRGVKRVFRAIARFKRAGYVTVHPRFEKTMNGEQDYTGLPAVRRILPKVFRELGIKLERLELRRKEASKRLRKKYDAYSKKLADSKLGQMMANVANRVSPGKRRQPARRGMQAISSLLDQEALQLPPDEANANAAEFEAVFPALAKLHKLMPDKPT